MTAPAAGTVHDARIPLSDGAWLAASVYLPVGCDAAHPAPALLEALPYRSVKNGSIASTTSGATFVVALLSR